MLLKRGMSNAPFQFVFSIVMQTIPSILPPNSEVFLYQTFLAMGFPSKNREGDEVHCVTVMFSGVPLCRTNLDTEPVQGVGFSILYHLKLR